jgi:hypothetical protein
LTSKGRVEEAIRLQPFDISNIPTESECIIWLRLVLSERYSETERRRIYRKEN